MNSKFKKFLSMTVDALTPSEMEDGAWGKGTMISSSFPGAKKLLIPPYIILGLIAVPIATTYFFGKSGYKALNKNYIDLKKIKELFPGIYEVGDTESLAQLVSKISYNGNEKIYDYMFNYFDQTPGNVEKTKAFTKGIVLNAKVKPKHFNQFFGNVLAALCAKDCIPAMKFMLNNEVIKEHIKKNNLFYEINKEELTEMVSYHRLGYVKPDPSLDYLLNLPDESLKFNTNPEPKRKPKM